MIGARGLPALLRERGYAVERVVRALSGRGACRGSATIDRTQEETR